MACQNHGDEMIWHNIQYELKRKKDGCFRVWAILCVLGQISSTQSPLWVLWVFVFIAFMSIKLSLMFHRGKLFHLFTSVFIKRSFIRRKCIKGVMTKGPLNYDLWLNMHFFLGGYIVVFVHDFRDVDLWCDVSVENIKPCTYRRKITSFLSSLSTFFFFLILLLLLP